MGGGPNWYNDLTGRAPPAVCPEGTFSPATHPGRFEKPEESIMTQTLTAPSGGLAVSDRILGRGTRGELSHAQVEQFRDFLAEVDRDLMHHRVITDNAYTRWFRDGTATDDELRHFIKQFSVFSNQFLIAALLRVIN